MKNYTTNGNRTSFLTAVITAALIAIPSIKPVYAEQYYKPTPDNLLPMIFTMGGLDLTDINVFSEFMKVTACDIYREFSKRDFDWKEIHKQFLKNQEDFKESKAVRYRILTELPVTGYNFDTMSFDISPEAAMKKVRVIAMNSGKYSYCEEHNIETQFRYIPNKVLLNLEVPLSVYRIPVNPSLAEAVIEKLDKDLFTGDRIVNAAIFVNVETVKKKETTLWSDSTDVYGYINRIEFYANAESRTPFKTLYYNE